jgi:glucose-6-phosphate isomerase
MHTEQEGYHMSGISFTYKNSCLIEQETLSAHVHHLTNAFKQQNSYDTPYASLFVPFDAKIQYDVEAVVTQVQLKNPRILFIVGIGGSNLGTCAVQQALQGIFYNETNPPCKIYYADTVDTFLMQTLSEFAEQALRNGDTILVNVISKSGTTLETLANFSIFCDLLRTYHPETWHEYSVVTTDHHSALWQYAHTNHISTLEIPALVGGRFSVLTPVGLFPFALLGLDTEQLCAGARDALTNNFVTNSLGSMAKISAAILYEQYLRGIMIHDSFIFCPQLEAFGKWYRQLCAESLGKKNSMDMCVGITPTVSIGTTDLHSMGQLYLGGPNNRVTTFICLEPSNISTDTALDSSLNTLLPQGAQKPLPIIMDAIAEGTQQAYLEACRPYMTIVLPDLSAYTMGNLMQYKMLEILYLGHLLQVNPFDQPEVEKYKQKTRTVL